MSRPKGVPSSTPGLAHACHVCQITHHTHREASHRHDLHSTGCNSHPLDLARLAPDVTASRDRAMMVAGERTEHAPRVLAGRLSMTYT